MENYLLTKSDLNKIVSDAKENMFRFNLPIYITRKEVEQRDISSLAVIESILMHLNSKNLLKRFIEIDYTDPSADHDQDELPDETPPR